MSKSTPPLSATVSNLLSRVSERLSGATRLRMRGIRENVEAISHRAREQFRQLTQRTGDNKGRIHQIGQLINQVTGYETCERLKRDVQEADRDFQQLKDELYHVRATFEAAIQSRSQCQKDLNSLLQRKQSWSDEDLHHFTELYRKEMRLEQREAEAKASHQQLEMAVDRAHQKLMDALRERYQEEQLWSDKIRRISTYGTVSLMILNLLLFLLIQLVLEPRKRQRLLQRLDAMLEVRLTAINARLQERRAGEQIQTSITPDPRQRPEISLPVLSEGKTAQVAIIGAGLVLALTFGKWIIS